MKHSYTKQVESCQKGKVQMAKVADFYVNRQGSKYSPVYVTPESSAVPILERWVVLLLTDKALLDFSNPQKFVTLPLNVVDKHFLGVVVHKNPERS